jgi:hypothetical protein
MLCALQRVASEKIYFIGNKSPAHRSNLQKTSNTDEIIADKMCHAHISHHSRTCARRPTLEVHARRVECA